MIQYVLDEKGWGYQRTPSKDYKRELGDEEDEDVHETSGNFQFTDVDFDDI